jgi:hypothetical protein
MHEFPHPKNRVRRIVEAALADSTYVSSQSEGDGSQLLLQARRTDGRRVSVRFRGVRESEATAEPEFGTPLRVVKVGNGNSFNIVSTLLPILRPPGPPHARVTIQAGSARLDIVCQDAEWWEDEASPD